MLSIAHAIEIRAFVLSTLIPLVAFVSQANACVHLLNHFDRAAHTISVFRGVLLGDFLALARVEMGRKIDGKSVTWLSSIDPVMRFRGFSVTPRFASLGKVESGKQFGSLLANKPATRGAEKFGSTVRLKS